MPTYMLTLTTPAGARVDLSPFLRSLSWEETENEIAARLEAELQNHRMHDGQWLHQTVPLGGQVMLTSVRQEIFRGTIFSWDYNTDPLGRFTIIAYDPLIYLTKSKDDRFYKAGQTARGIIQDIARAWNIPLGDVQGPGTVLAKQVFRSETLADMILSVLEQAKQRGDGNWIIRSNQGRLDVVREGQNSMVIQFSAATNVSTVNDRQDIDDLVTRVKIVGAAEADEHAPVIATVDGRTEFGILQEIIDQRQHNTPAAARSAAQDILNERGQPRRRRQIEAPDVPTIRKGDRVRITAGTLNGNFIVTGTSHNATTASMTLEVR